MTLAILMAVSILPASALAEEAGGAIHFGGNTQTQFEGTEFKPNEAASSGGAIYLQSGGLLLGGNVKSAASNEADIVPLIAPAPLAEDNTMLNFCVDVKTSDYFYDAVLWFYENGYTTGVDNVHFAPNAGITRGELITLLWRMAGSPVVNYWMQMEDVEPDAYYTEAVRWALAEKLTAGTGTTTFSPEKNCSRAEAATLLYRYFDGHKVATTPSNIKMFEPLDPIDLIP